MTGTHRKYMPTLGLALLGVMLPLGHDSALTTSMQAKALAAPRTDVAGKERPTPIPLTAPLFFEANQGQSDARVRYLSRGNGYTLFLTETEAVLSLQKQKNEGGRRQETEFSGKDFPPRIREPQQTLRMQLSDANPTPQMTGVEELAGKANYFIGKEPAQWRTNVPLYAKVKAEAVYPGIDMLYYGNQQQLEYDFIVAPGADPKQIVLSFSGTDTMEVDARGNLLLHTKVGTVVQHAPQMYQEVNGVRHPVAGGYVLHETKTLGADSEVQRVGFTVAAYDRSKPLVIDPVIWFATFLGGSGSEFGGGIAVQANGNTYVTGSTSSSNFPGAASGAFTGDDDVFVVKYNATTAAGQTPTVAYVALLGGSGFDEGMDIAVDTNGNAYLTGITGSFNLPTPNGFQIVFAGTGNSEFPRDAFIAKLNATGSALLYSTYLGGSSFDSGYGIALDTSNNVWVTGHTLSASFFTANPFRVNNQGGTDAFVGKFNLSASAAASVLYLTFLGGSGTDFGNAIAVDSSGNAYVTGGTASSNFPLLSPTALPPFQGDQPNNDVFVTKFRANAAGASSLIYSTYLGGNGVDTGFGITVDASNNAHVTGSTTSSNFPLKFAKDTTQSQTEAFVTKLDATGTGLVFSTFVGGTVFDAGHDIAVISGDTFTSSVFITGKTASGGLTSPPPPSDPRRPPGPAPNLPQPIGYAGQIGAIFNETNGTVQFGLTFFQYLTGTTEGNSITLDGENRAYVVGTANAGFSTQSASQPSFGGGGRDAFVLKYGRLNLPPSLTCSVTTSVLAPPNHQLVNVGLNVVATDDTDTQLPIHVAVFSNQSDGNSGSGSHTPDAQNVAPQTLQLRAERSGGGDGRIYLIQVVATDSEGAAGIDCCTVVVPHDRGRNNSSTLYAQAAVAEETCVNSGNPPEEYFTLRANSSRGR